MTQAIALLQAAMALLAMVSGSNSPEMAQITQQATDIAQSAITLATEEIAKIEGQYNLPSQQTKVTVDVPITNPTTKEVTTVKVTQETTVGTGASQEVVQEIELPEFVIFQMQNSNPTVVLTSNEIDFVATKVFIDGQLANVNLKQLSASNNTSSCLKYKTKQVCGFNSYSVQFEGIEKYATVSNYVYSAHTEVKFVDKYGQTTSKDFKVESFPKSIQVNFSGPDTLADENTLTLSLKNNTDQRVIINAVNIRYGLNGDVEITESGLSNQLPITLDSGAEKKISWKVNAIHVKERSQAVDMLVSLETSIPVIVQGDIAQVMSH